MGSLQGPVVCPVVRAKQTGIYTVPLYTPLGNATKLVRSGFWGFKGNNGFNVANQTRRQTNKMIRCTFSSSSNGNGSMAGNFNENDADYVNSSVVEAGMHLGSFDLILLPFITSSLSSNHFRFVFLSRYFLLGVSHRDVSFLSSMMAMARKNTVHSIDNMKIE